MNLQSKKYNDIYPSFSISHPVKDIQLTLNYSRKNIKPSYYSLDGNIQYETRNVYSSGNPLLQPTTFHDIQLMASYKGLSFSFDYIKKKNVLIHDYKYYDELKSIILSTYTNYHDMNTIQASISYSKVIGLWHPSLSANVYLSNLEILHGDIKEKMDIPYITFSLRNIFHLNKNLYVYLNGNYSFSGDYDENWYRNTGYVSLNVVKEWKRFSLDILFNDIFNTNTTKFNVYSQICTYKKYNCVDSRNMQIRIRYKINYTHSKYKGGNIISKESERM